MKKSFRISVITATAAFLTTGAILAPASMADSSAPAVGSRTVSVFAASSLTKVYTALAAKFEAAFPQVNIKLSFGSSTTLATQINAGAPVDIFASADLPDMTEVASEFPHAFNYLVNQVVIAVPKSSRITKESDLNGSTQWLQCGHTVPCGIAADAALKSDGLVTSSPLSLESSDANALAKLLNGSVDAAIVFKTDVIANPTKIRAISFKDAAAASSQYQIALSNQRSTVKNHWAQTFYSYLKGFQAKKFLAANGFVVNQ